MRSVYKYRLAVGERRKQERVVEHWSQNERGWQQRISRARKAIIGIEAWGDSRYVKKPGKRWGSYVDCTVCDFDKLLEFQVEVFPMEGSGGVAGDAGDGADEGGFAAAAGSEKRADFAAGEGGGDI